jgi:formylglycine-generating enzyme required for sulfatase activity
MRVFISYARTDQAFVRPLVDALHGAGVQTWVDYAEIPPGANWDQAIKEGLDACEALVVVLTPDGVASENVTAEWSYFLDLGRPVFPVLGADCDVPFRLRLRQHVDFRDDRASALVRLLAALGVEPPAAEPPQPIEPEMLLIPAGPFLMGSDPARDPHARDDEQPQHTVTLPDYTIGKYPVTVAEFRAFIEAGGYREPRWWSEAGWAQCERDGWTEPLYWRRPKWTGDDRLPVIGVSWFEALTYCQWLAAVTGRDYRLPTEAEWEKAARGTDGRIYPWGDDWLADACNNLERWNGVRQEGQTMPVGSFSPVGDSPYGAVDMVGNTWEWCRTQWRARYDTPANDDPGGRVRRVARGGSWYYDLTRVRCASRRESEPSAQWFGHGFRVACDA